MPRRKKYEERDPAWTHNHESRYQRGVLFVKKRGPTCPRLGVVAIADLGTVQHPIYAPHPTYDGGVRQIDLKQCIESTLELLTPREENIVRRVFGFGTDASSLSQVARDLGRSVECIRQVYNRAIRKLRHPARRKHLKDFWVNG